MSEAPISGRAEVFAAEQYFDEEGHQESGGIGELYCHRLDHSISSHVGHQDQGQSVRKFKHLTVFPLNQLQPLLFSQTC